MAESDDGLRRTNVQKQSWVVSCLLTFALGAPGYVVVQERPDPQAVLAAQRQALARLAFMDGVWRGTAWTMRPSGEKHTVTQTERIGPFLDGTIRVIEGLGYDSDGKVTFNAFGNAWQVIGGMCGRLEQPGR